MTHGIGKKKWRWQPAFDRQLQDGRSHITCPKCNASLGDAWDGKGGREWSPVGAFAHQYQDGRQHLTCPRCSFLLGQAYWQHPTAWDWIKYIFSERSGVTGMLAASLIIVVGASTLGVAAYSYTGAIPVTVFLKEINFTILCWVGIPLWILTFLALWGHENTTDDDWWWWWND